MNTPHERLALCAAVVGLYAASFLLPIEFGTRRVGGTPLLGIGGRDEPYTVYGWQLFDKGSRAGLILLFTFPALALGLLFLGGGKRKAAGVCGIVGLMNGLAAAAIFGGPFSSAELGVGGVVWALFPAVLPIAAATSGAGPTPAPGGDSS